MSRIGLVTAMLPPAVGGTEVLVWRLFQGVPGTVVVAGSASETAPPFSADEPFRALEAPTIFLPYPRFRGYRYGLAPLIGLSSAVWLFRALGRAVRFLSELRVQQIISIPHSGPFALLGLLAARRLGLPHTFYILDAWEEAATGPIERVFIRRGLHLAAGMADSRLAAVSPALAAHYRDRFGFRDCVWIPNAAPLPIEVPPRDIRPTPTVVFSGMIKPFNTEALRCVIRAIRRCRVATKLIVTGPSFLFSETLRSWGELHDRVEFKMGSRAEVAVIQRQAAVLLTATNVDDLSETSRGYLPGRLPEYVAARRPILAIGPEGSDALRVVQHWHLGRTLSTCDEIDIAAALDELTLETMNALPAPRIDYRDLFLEVFSRAEARRRLFGEAAPELSDQAAALASSFEQPIRHDHS